MIILALTLMLLIMIMITHMHIITIIIIIIIIFIMLIRDFTSADAQQAAAGLVRLGDGRPVIIRDFKDTVHPFFESYTSFLELFLLPFLVV